MEVKPPVEQISINELGPWGDMVCSQLGLACNACCKKEDIVIAWVTSPNDCLHGFIHHHSHDGANLLK